MATSDQTAGLNSLDADGNGLCVEFFREGDRFAHRVLAVAAHRPSVELLRSIEGTPAQDWPDSPALQALNVDQLRSEGGPAALIGMSGRTHWSLSVERRQDAGPAALLFDAACRVRKSPKSLATSYCAAPRVHIAVEGRFMASVGLHTSAYVVRTFSCGAQQGGPTTLAVDGDRLFLTVDPNSRQSASRTIRWQYAIEAVGGDAGAPSLSPPPRPA